jgi:soluble lytic murein transglycosylase-like protein
MGLLRMKTTWRWHATAALLAILALQGQSAPPAPKQAQAQEIVFQASLKKQLESLREQHHALDQQTGLKADDDDFIPPLPVLIQANCAPLPASEVKDLIAEAAHRQLLDPALIRAVMHQESGFRPCAVSIKGALGLMQLMPATAAQLHVSNAFDPAQNVAAGAKFLKELLTRYNGDLRLALVAYNAGSARADLSPAGPYPAETQAYLANIFAELDTGSGVPASTTEQSVTPRDDGNSAKTHSPPPAPEPQEKTQAGQTAGSPRAAQ